MDELLKLSLIAFVAYIGYQAYNSLTASLVPILNTGSSSVNLNASNQPIQVQTGNAALISIMGG